MLQKYSYQIKFTPINSCGWDRVTQCPTQSQPNPFLHSPQPQSISAQTTAHSYPSPVSAPISAPISASPPQLLVTLLAPTPARDDINALIRLNLSWKNTFGGDIMTILCCYCWSWLNFENVRWNFHHIKCQQQEVTYYAINVYKAIVVIVWIKNSCLCI